MKAIKFLSMLLLVMALPVIVGCKGDDDEEVLDALVNESDELAHICELYQYKMAS